MAENDQPTPSALPVPDLDQDLRPTTTRAGNDYLPVPDVEKDLVKTPKQKEVQAVVGGFSDIPEVAAAQAETAYKPEYRNVKDVLQYGVPSVGEKSGEQVAAEQKAAQAPAGGKLPVPDIEQDIKPRAEQVDLVSKVATELEKTGPYATSLPQARQLLDTLDAGQKQKLLETHKWVYNLMTPKDRDEQFLLHRQGAPFTRQDAENTIGNAATWGLNTALAGVNFGLDAAYAKVVAPIEAAYERGSWTGTGTPSERERKANEQLSADISNISASIPGGLTEAYRMLKQVKGDTPLAAFAAPSLVFQINALANDPRSGGLAFLDHINREVSGNPQLEREHWNQRMASTAEDSANDWRARQGQQQLSPWSQWLYSPYGQALLQQRERSLLPPASVYAASMGIPEDEAEKRLNQLAEKNADANSREMAVKLNEEHNQAMQDFGGMVLGPVAQGPAGLALGAVGVARKLGGALETLGMSDEAVNAYMNAKQARQALALERETLEAAKPTAIGTAAEKTVALQKNIAENFQNLWSKIPEQAKPFVPLALKYIGLGTAGGAVGEALEPEAPARGLLEGITLATGLGAAPGIVADIEAARRAIAGGEGGILAKAGAAPGSSMFTKALFGGSRGEVADYLVKNIGPTVKAGVDLGLMNLLTSTINSDDPKQYAESVMNGFTTGVGFHLLGGSFKGLHENTMQESLEDRKKRDIEIYHAVSSASPQTQANIDRISDYNNAVNRAKLNTLRMQAMLSDARATGDQQKIAEAQKAVNVAQALQSQVMRANVQTRNEYGRNLRSVYADLHALANGSRSGQGRIRMELLTTQEIFNKLKQENDEQKLGKTDEQLKQEAKYPGRYSKSKNEAIINADNILRRQTLFGESPTQALRHEIGGHGLASIPEFRKLNEEAEKLLFDHQDRDLRGNILAETKGKFSDDDLVKMYFDEYLKGSNADQKLQFARDNGLWDDQNNTINRQAVVDYMKEEVIAELNAGNLRFGLGKLKQDSTAIDRWLSQRKDSTVAQNAVRTLTGMGAKPIYSELLGTTFDPEIVAANRAALSAMAKSDGNFTDTTEEAKGTDLPEKVLRTNPVLRKRYSLNGGEFKTQMVAEIRDKNGKLVGRPLPLPENSAEGSWTHDETTNTIKKTRGYGQLNEAAGISVPLGGSVEVKRDFVYEPDGITPIRNSDSEINDLEENRNNAIRQALETDDRYSGVGLIPVSADGLSLSGLLSPKQIQAIKDIPESILPLSIKEKIFEFNDAMARDDGSTYDIDYAARLKGKKYKGRRSEIYGIIPINWGFSKEGHFYNRSVSLGALFRKVKARKKLMPGWYAPWGGSTEEFMDEFRNVYLKNTKEGKDGWMGLDPAHPTEKTDLAVMKQRKFNDMMNLANRPFEITPRDPQKRGSKAGDVDTVWRSFRLDAIADMAHTPERKYPMNAKRIYENLMPREVQEGLAMPDRLGYDPDSYEPKYEKTNPPRLGFRAPEASQQGRQVLAENPVLAQALDAVKGATQAAGNQPQGTGPSVKEAQAQALREFAQRTGVKETPENTEKWGDDWAYWGRDAGTEHQVSVGEGNRVEKRSDAPYHDWKGYLDRILLHNMLFPDAAPRLENFHDVDYKQEDINGKPWYPGLYAKTSQPYIDGRHIDVATELKPYMEGLGFVSDGPMHFYHPDLGIHVSDIHPGNAYIRKDAQGRPNVQVFDPMIHMTGTQPGDAAVRERVQKKLESAGTAYMPREIPEIQREIGRNEDFLNMPVEEDAKAALDKAKQPKFGAARDLKEGYPVALRIDIPAFNRTGNYVVTVHEKGTPGSVGSVIGYDNIARVTNPKFSVKPGVEKIYRGAAKFPVATVDGEFNPSREIPKDINDWTPVGFDPKEHSFFYDKANDQVVLGGDEAISVGNTVFVKNPVYGERSKQAFMPRDVQEMDDAHAELERRYKEGDEKAYEEAQRLSDEKAKEMGYPIAYPLYRGVRRKLNESGVMQTQGGRATLSFTDVPEVAKLYTHDREMFGGITPSATGSVKKVYLDLKNPLDLRDEGTKVNLGDIIGRYTNYDFKTNAEVDPETTFTADDLKKLFVRFGKLENSTQFESDIQASDNEGLFRLRDFSEVRNAIEELMDGDDMDAAEKIQDILDSIDLDTYALADNQWFIKALKQRGYDGLIHKDTIEAGKDFFKNPSVAGKPIEEVKGIDVEDDYSHDTYRPFESSQIKLSDPFTYDEQGNLIPLSQRFNPASPDIRYMAREVREDEGTKPTEGSLVDEDSLKKLDALGDKNSTQVDADTRPYKVNPNPDSVTLPPRWSFVNRNIVGMPRSFKEVTDILNRAVDRLKYVAAQKPEFAKKSARFYRDMAESAVKMADGIDPSAKGLDKWLLSELNLRFLALGSPRSSVVTNATKSSGSAAAVPGGFESGYKIGFGEQSKGARDTYKAWQQGQHFDLNLPGVQDKVRSFYINGLSELIEMAEEAGDTEAAEELRQRAGKSLRVLDADHTEKLTPEQNQDIQRLLDGKATIDMWDMAAKGFAWPGYLLNKAKRNNVKQPFQWSQDKFAKDSTIDSKAGQQVLKELGYTNWSDLRYQEARALRLDGNPDWNEQTWEERKSQPFAPGTKFTYFTQGTEAGLTPGGGGPLYDAQQGINGLLADKLNELGMSGMFGKTKLKARNAQEILWALEKLDNPVKANNDLSLFGATFDPFLQEVNKLRQGQPLDKKSRGANVLAAMDRAYAQMSPQIMPLEVVTQGTSPQAERVQSAIAALEESGDKNAVQTITYHVANGLHDKINELATKYNLDVTVDSVDVGEGGYTEGTQVNVAPNMRLILRGSPQDTRMVLEALSRSLDQDGGNIIRKPTVRELNDANVKKNVVLTLGTNHLEKADRNKLFLDLAALKDAEGNSFLTGFTETDQGAAIGDQFYGGNMEEALKLNADAFAKVIQKYGVQDYELAKGIVDMFFRGQKETAASRGDFQTELDQHIARRLAAKPGRGMQFPQVTDAAELWSQRADDLFRKLPTLGTKTKQTEAKTKLKSDLEAAVLRGVIDEQTSDQLKAKYGFKEAKPKADEEPE
jgi:hypothetical protein